VSDSYKAVFRVTGTIVLALALCLAVAMGLAACGGDDAADATVEVSTTAVDVTATTLERLGPSILLCLASGLRTDRRDLEFTSDGKMVITSDTGEDTVEFTYTVEGTDVVYGIQGRNDHRPYSIDGDVLTIVNPDVAGL